MTKTTKKTRRPLSNAQREKIAAKTKAEVESFSAQLEEGIAALADVEEWKAWLRQIGRFHSYSFNNLMLIRAQMPTATRCAGYRAWQGLGRQVRKGEKGLRIFAPIIVRDRENPEERRVVGFKMTSTFDVSQTDGDDLAEKPGIPYARDDFDAAAEAEVRILDVAARLGVELDALYQNLPPAERARALAIDLAAQLGPKDTGRARAAVECEAVAYIVCQSLDVDTEVSTFPTVLEFVRGSVADVVRVGDSIRKTAHKILAALEAQVEGESDEELAAA